MADFANQVATLLEQDSAHSFSVPEQEKLYTLGYQLYDQGRYGDCVHCFMKLALCNPFIHPYWCGLASSHQMQKSYREALHAWGVAALLNEKDPLPHFHAAECYFSLKEFDEALKALNSAEVLLTNSMNDVKLLEKIQVLRQVHDDSRSSF
jgi:type III secretion system low calcium response chaperone LcrH/SycD